MAHFKLLQTLDAAFCGLDTIAFMAEAPMADLETLNVYGGRVESIVPLRACPRLRHLTLKARPQGVDWSPLGSVRRLESLRISDVN